MFAAKGFAIQKVLKNGKLIDEQGIMGEFDNKQGARIVEVSDGKAKYTELTPNDIMKLISHPARYCSRASAAFLENILPLFASMESPLKNKLNYQDIGFRIGPLINSSGRMAKANERNS